MQQLVACLLEFQCRGADRCGVGNVKFNADLRHRPPRWPFISSEARLGGLGQRPDAEGLAAGYPLAVVITGPLALQRQAKRLHIQLVAAGRIGRDPATVERNSMFMPSPRVVVLISAIQSGCALTRSRPA